MQERDRGQRQSAKSNETTPPVDRQAYKQSKWARVVDVFSLAHSILRASSENDALDSPTVRGIDSWTNWMIEGGFRQSDEEILAKLSEDLPPSLFDSKP